MRYHLVLNHKISQIHCVYMYWTHLFDQFTSICCTFEGVLKKPIRFAIRIKITCGHNTNLKFDTSDFC